MSTNTLVVEAFGDVSVLTLNQPERANALSSSLVTNLAERIRQLRHDKKCRVVIITGAGRSFCGGADLQEKNRPENYLDMLRRLMMSLEEMPQPVIAAINGACRGGGTELALACDFRVISESASIGLPEITFGALPSSGGTQRLPRLVGLSRAKRLLLTGEPIGASEAFEFGLVDRVVDDGKVVELALELASKISERPRYAVTAGKFLANLAFDVPLERGLSIEATAIETMATPEERKAARQEASENSDVYRRILDDGGEAG